jgi:hypothetical protein
VAQARCGPVRSKHLVLLGRRCSIPHIIAVLALVLIDGGGGQRVSKLGRWSLR